MSGPVHLRSYNNSWYSPGRSNLWRAAWMFLGQPVFGSTLLPSSALRIRILRIFGAQIGSGVVIHSGVKVKYPWFLVVGDDCWIGEEAWIDNLTTVRLGNDVCVSQGAYFCTGNHDWSDPAFGLIVRGIELKDGAWAGAKCLLLPGAKLGTAAVASAGSVVSGPIPDYEIHAGNPARRVRTRRIGEGSPTQRRLEKVAG